LSLPSIGRHYAQRRYLIVLLRAVSNPGLKCDRKDSVNGKSQIPRRESNCDLPATNSASANCTLDRDRREWGKILLEAKVHNGL
jgi:hypothetical protein